jgi:hypothetical protein
MEDNALAMLHRVAGGNIVPPRRAGALARPLKRMLAADPADRPDMTEIRDQLATLAAGRGGNTTTVLLARTNLRSNAPNRARTTAFPGGSEQDGGTPRVAAPAQAAAGAMAAAAAPAPPPAAPRTPSPPLPRTLTSPAASDGDSAAGPTAAPVVVGAAGAAPAGAAPTKAGASTAAPPDRTPRAHTPPRRPPEPGSKRGRKRGRALWIAAALVAAMLAGLIAFVVTRPDAQDPSTEASSPTASSSSAEATEEETTAAAEATDPAGEQPVTDDTPPADPLSAATITTFLQDYHRQVLSDPRGAYARTGPTLRSLISEDNYVGYWNDFADVRLSDIRATDGQRTATAFMELVYPGGGTESGTHEFTLIVGDDGRLILDSDFPV